MNDERTPEERAAVEAAVQRVHASTARVQSTWAELAAAIATNDWARRLDASVDALVAIEEELRARLDAGRVGAATDLAMTQAEVASLLANQQRGYRLLFREHLETQVMLAFVEDDDPAWRSLRERARSHLLRHGLLTEQELESLPPASVSAVVWNRFRVWDEENPL